MTSAEQYRAAGVDLAAAEAAKKRIAALVASTQTPLSRGAVGGFGGMVRVPPDVDRPVLVMSTDGVGTKVLVAIRARRHDTVGEDLVNHCVNDILVLGARPVAFLDYVAHAGAAAETLAAIVAGVARGCRTHGMALVGGETAQLPDLYQPGHYDLAGTIVGVVSDGHATGAHRVRPGDRLLGYAASGLHTNGYTLARRIVFDRMGLDVDDPFPDTDAAVADVLLEVHRSYWTAITPALPSIHALAHITGGGIPGNLVRSLPEGCGAVVRREAWPAPAVFRVLQDGGGVTDDEMVRVFNMGVGMIAMVPPDRVTAVRECARDAAVEAWDIGEVVEGDGVDVR